jgi:opacity protein-like surface antigen
MFVGGAQVSDTFSPQVDDYSYDGAFLNGFEAIASGKGGIVGAQVGYRYQTGSMVLGVSGDVSKSSATAEEILYNSYSEYDYGGSVELKSVASLRASVGYAFGSTLISVSAGPARASVTQSVTDDYEFGTETWDSNLSGYVAGVGVSHAVNDHLVIDGEVSLLSFEGDSYTESEGYAYKSDLSTAQVRVGVSYKF